MQKAFSFTAQVWLYPGKAGWHFITLPTETAQEIDFYFAHQKKGWGSLPVVVHIDTTSWNTSIFPDSKSSSYLLPLKAVIRKDKNITAGDTLSIILEVVA